MPAALTEYGINLFWGLGPTTITVTNATGIYQSFDYNPKIDKQEVRDQRGTIATINYYNPYEEASVVYYASDANSASGSAVPTWPDRGTAVSIVASTALSGSGWKVDDISLSATNTDALKVTVKASRYLNIA